MPESLCSVHSKITCTRLPFLAIFRELGCKYSESCRANKAFLQTQHSRVEKLPKTHVFQRIGVLALPFGNGLTPHVQIQKNQTTQKPLGEQSGTSF